MEEMKCFQSKRSREDYDYMTIGEFICKLFDVKKNVDEFIAIGKDFYEFTRIDVPSCIPSSEHTTMKLLLSRRMDFKVAQWALTDRVKVLSTELIKSSTLCSTCEGYADYYSTFEVYANFSEEEAKRKYDASKCRVITSTGVACEGCLDMMQRYELNKIFHFISLEALTSGGVSKSLPAFQELLPDTAFYLEAGYLHFGDYEAYRDGEKWACNILNDLVAYYEKFGFKNVNELLGYEEKVAMLYLPEKFSSLK